MHCFSSELGIPSSGGLDYKLVVRDVYDEDTKNADPDPRVRCKRLGPEESKMFKRRAHDERAECQSQPRERDTVLHAVCGSVAYIEFISDGHVLGVYDCTLETVARLLDEVMGEGHRLFCADGYTELPPQFEGYFWVDFSRAVTPIDSREFEGASNRHLFGI
ncbi:hypothetical protein [Guyparkeria sp.]|uniref:hypothetical protein n=1 Tax=Guyparkeria sp. TaxID=2035736 RepID=UPI003970C170